MPTSPRLLRHQFNLELGKIRDAAFVAGDVLLAGQLTIVINAGAADAPPNFQKELYLLMLEKFDAGCAEKGIRRTCTSTSPLHHRRRAGRGGGRGSDGRRGAELICDVPGG